MVYTVKFTVSETTKNVLHKIHSVSSNDGLERFFWFTSSWNSSQTVRIHFAPDLTLFSVRGAKLRLFKSLTEAIDQTVRSRQSKMRAKSASFSTTQSENNQSKKQKKSKTYFPENQIWIQFSYWTSISSWQVAILRYLLQFMAVFQWSRASQIWKGTSNDFSTGESLGSRASRVSNRDPGRLERLSIETRKLI